MRFKSAAGEAAFLACYDRMLADWPVPRTALRVPTRFGATHVLASGPADGPPLVLLHALGTTSAVWIRNVAALSQAYRTYLVDIIGDANKSEWEAPLRSRAECAAWLEEVLDGLHVERAHLGGLSYGGWHSLNFGLAAPERVRSLILLAPAASFAPFGLSFFLHLLGPMLLPTRWSVRRTFRWLSAARHETDERLADQLYMAVRHFKFPKGGIYPTVFADDELRRVSVPTLLLVGEHEVIYEPKAVLDRARRLIPDIHAELVPAAGHVLVMEQADLVNERVLAFLGRVEAAAEKGEERL